MKSKIIWLIVILVGLALLLIAKEAKAFVAVSTPVSLGSVAPLVYQIPLYTLKQRIQQEFSPRMVKVVSCESQFRQFIYATTTLKSPTDDWGIMQINWPTWGDISLKMGLDIKGSAEDNIKMGKYILGVQGEDAWTCNRLI